MDSPVVPPPLRSPRCSPVSRPIALARWTAHPALLVAADAWLFRHIVSFQAGIPVALRQFWIRHDPKPVRGPITHDEDARHDLMKLVVKFGSVDTLALMWASRSSWGRAWFTRKLDGLARMAIKHHRADVLQWMLANGISLPTPRVLWREAVVRSRHNDDFSVFELLQKLYPLTDSEAQQHIANALSRPKISLLRWIHARYPTVIFPVRISRAAAADRDLVVLTYLFENKHNRDHHIKVLWDAYTVLDCDVFEYLLANFADYMPPKLAQAIVHNRTLRIKRIIAKHQSIFASALHEVFLEYVRAGNCDGMEEVYALGAINDTDILSIDGAAKWDGLAGLTFLHERGLARATSEAMDVAAEAKRWDVVEFLHAYRTEGCTSRAVNGAVRSGEVKWLEFFLEVRGENCSPTAMDLAAATGSMEILQYLHQKDKVECTTDAMDGAATQGHFRVVKFLHENRSEGCTTNAIDGASRGGFLDVVQYLCEHRNEGCTKAAVQGALENHHFEVVDFLYEQYPHLFGTDVLFDLLLRGAFDYFMKLRDYFPEEAGSVVKSVMFEAGKQLELRTIWFILNKLGRSDLRQFAVDGAARLEGHHIEQWRRAVDEITNPRQPSKSTMSLNIHPFLLDVRTPSWAIETIFTDKWVDADVYKRCWLPLRWPIRAVYRHDLTLLQVIRDLPSDTTEPFLGPFCSVFEPFSFGGARAAAIRVGHKKILEWLLTNVDLPVEKTLLDEAVYYHQYEIAEWLLVNHPEACTELDWTNKGNETTFHNFGLQDGLLDWLESHDGVREALSFSGIIDFAARKNDVESLTRLYAWYPELFTPRASLVALADLEECSDTINFLLEIGWSADVFF